MHTHAHMHACMHTHLHKQNKINITKTFQDQLPLNTKHYSDALCIYVFKRSWEEAEESQPRVSCTTTGFNICVLETHAWACMVYGSSVELVHIWFHDLSSSRSPDPIIDGCEPLCSCWEMNSRPLEEQAVLLTAEPSLQSTHLVFCFAEILSIYPHK